MDIFADMLYIFKNDLYLAQKHNITLFEYFNVSYIKTGLLPNSRIMQCILELLPENTSLISDPLIESTSGYRIMDEETLDFFQSVFIKKVDYLTPNFPEFNLLFDVLIFWKELFLLFLILVLLFLFVKLVS